MVRNKLLIGLLLIIGISSWAVTNSHLSTGTSSKPLVIVSSDSSRAEVYPTNFSTEIFISGASDPEQEVRVEIFDLSGLLIRTFVLEQQLSDNPITINLASVTENVIIVRVYEGQTVLKKERLFKN